MLKNFKKSITITGQSVIEVTAEDGTTKQVVAETYNATINSADPGNMNLSSYQNDKAVCKANRIQCREDEAEFEDACYAIQDEMIAELASVTE
jgi:hypothetical protein